MLLKHGYVIKQLVQAGVEIFEYVHGRSLTPTTSTAKLLSSVQGFSDEDHAVRTSERVIEAHTKLFEMGASAAAASSATTTVTFSKARTPGAARSSPIPSAR